MKVEHLKHHLMKYIRKKKFHNNPLYLMKSIFFSSRKWKNPPRYKALHGRFKRNIICGHWNVELAMLLSTLIEVFWYYLLPAKTWSMLGNLIEHGSHRAGILNVIACTGNSSTMSLCITIFWDEDSCEHFGSFKYNSFSSRLKKEIQWWWDPSFPR
jgi:hypothetical protein